ncbi:hypothetical protein BASA83_011241 [Batrachochytrium salamandrivorans]|nr:hypothetical protein BASA83_011241 [Batrachochytrium salamandrivorans]
MTVDQLISNSNEWYKAPSATVVSGESLMIPHEIASVSGASPASIVIPIETTRLSPSQPIQDHITTKQVFIREATT